MTKNIDIGGRLHSTATGNIVTGANEVYDDNKGKKQSEINTEIHNYVENINNALKNLNPEQQEAIDIAEKTNNNEVKLGYYVCDTEGNLAEKVISDATSYILSKGGSIKVKMTNVNTADNATLNINSTGAKPLYYSMERASSSNSWKAGETVEVYYDGTNFFANNVSGSSDDVFDISAKTGQNYETLDDALTAANSVIPTSKKKGGMSIKFVQSSDNKYVQYRYMGTSVANADFSNVANWQGVDDEPTPRSGNLVKSGGVANKFAIILGEEAETIDLSSYDADSGVVDLDTLIYRNNAGYGNHRYKVIPVVGGKTIKVTPIDTSHSAKILPMKDNVFVSGSAVNACDGITSAYIYYRETEMKLPDDALYLYIYTMNGSGTSFEPTDIEYVETQGLIDDLQSEITENAESIDILDRNVKTISDSIDDVNDVIFNENESIEDVPLTIHTVEGVNGYWHSSNGNWTEGNDRRSSDKLDVVAGEKYLVTTRIGSSTLIAYLAQWNGDTWVGVADGFTGGSGNAVDREYTVPDGVTKIAICNYNSHTPSLKKVLITKEASFYTKQETEAKFAAKSEVGKYGVKWSTSDSDDLGQRCFDAVGLTATIGEGNDDGSSDFDSIYPWSEIKRCNIKVNANGAKIVTFEGESGFALDGSNGDVFVRIPKFCVEKYVDNGYEYRVVSRNQGNIHPAFIENGNEIDEIFIGAFEGYLDNSVLKSIAGVIPTSNIVAQDFLDAAQAKGSGYTLYDMRAVDAIWTLASVEFGKRNTNQYLGYGFADFMQPVDNPNTHYLTIIEAATNTNSVKIPSLGSKKMYMPVGSNITVCDTEQSNILTQAKILSVTDGDNYTEFTFDGPAIDVTTNCFIGSAACTTNFAETCGNNVKLNWHTGRPLFVSGTYADRRNPVRYRWIENIIGSLWHFLPDVTFVNLQMYVCDNIKDYVCHKYTSPYRPVGALLPAQSDNGQKNDNVGVNHWVSSLLNDIFAKGNCFGKSFDDNLTSRKAFGAFYYLRNAVDVPYIISNGGGFDHEIRCNMLTNRAWQNSTQRWYLYGARLMFKNI